MERKKNSGLCFLIFPKSWPGRNRLHCTVSGSLGKRAREMFFLSWIRTSLSIQMVSGWFPCPCVRCSSLPRSGAICQKTRLRPQSCRSRKHRTNRFKEQRMDRPYPWQIRFHKKTTVNKPKKKASTGVLVVLTVILVVILCLILIYIFRDSLKPLLEQILYSAEERQLL